MTAKSDTENNTRNEPCRGLMAAELQVKREREQALEWVSQNALSTVQSTWCKAGQNDRRSI